MSGAQIGILVAMIVYLGLMVTIGAVVSRRNMTVGDFYLGGRKLGPLVTAMSAEASDMSSWLLMGLPGVAYLSGLADVTWTIIGLAVGTYLNWLFVAKPLRRYSETTGSITLPTFFSDRYGDDSHVLMLVAAAIIIIFFVPYTASGFAACGKLFGSLFGANYHAAMIISACVIILYTTLGGFLAASFTDLIQSIVMTIALIIVLGFATKTAGGFGAVMDNAKSLPGYFSLTATHDPVSGTGSPYGFITILSTMAWGLGYFGMPHILLRFMAIRDDEKIKVSRRIATIWVVIAMFVAMFIGMAGLTMSKVGAVPVLEGSASETIIVKIADLLSRNGIFFAVIAGVVLSGILACTMSTSDSQLLAASSSVSHDILTGFFRMKIDEKKLLMISRLSLCVIAVIGVILAWDSDSNVFRIVSFAWAGFGAAFGPVMLLALFWRRSNKWGALAGMICGGAMIFIWKFGVRPLGGAWNIYELLPAFIIAIVVNVIVSLATKAPDKAVTDVFDRVKSM
ncbi:MAG: sodium/proline symporter [Lachnospiraceae bacterium]|nr:sodium/proline symporter [Lachnospiraceae bacterium]